MHRPGCEARMRNRKRIEFCSIATERFEVLQEEDRRDSRSSMFVPAIEIVPNGVTTDVADKRHRLTVVLDHIPAPPLAARMYQTICARRQVINLVTIPSPHV
jgi:hypothetical protein